MKKIVNDDDRLKEQKKVEVVDLERLPAGAGEALSQGRRGTSSGPPLA